MINTQAAHLLMSAVRLKQTGQLGNLLMILNTLKDKLSTVDEDTTLIYEQAAFVLTFSGNQTQVAGAYNEISHFLSLLIDTSISEIVRFYFGGKIVGMDAYSVQIQITADKQSLIALRNLDQSIIYHYNDLCHLIKSLEDLRDIGG
jgi:hypothetical protein